MKLKALFVVVLVVLVAYLSLPDYTVYTSFANSSGSGSDRRRDVHLDVIAFRYWNLDDLLEDIKDVHNSINGEPTSLEIDLYASKWHLFNSEPLKTIEYNKDEP